MGNLRKSAPLAQVSSEIIQIIKKEGLLFQDAFEDRALSLLIRKYFPNFRERIFSPSTTLFAFLSQMLSPDKSCAETVARINAERAAKGLELISPDTSAYCKARDRMPENFIQELATDTASAIEEKTPIEWLWKGRRTKLIDGSTATMADTPENQSEYPQHGRQEKGAGFPITRIMAVFSLATGCILDFANGPYQGKGTGEHGLLRQLMHCFHKGDLVVGDAYFPSYFLIATLQIAGADCLFASDGKRYTDFRMGERIGKKDHLVFWQKPPKPIWMSQGDYDQTPDSIQIRECIVHIERPGFRSITSSLVTTLLDTEYAPKKELGWLYGQRWAAELNLSAIKTVLKMEHLRCKTPEMVRKEIWMTLLAYNLIRKIMGEAAYQHDTLPREISFKSTVQHLNAFRPLWSMPGINIDGSMIQKLLLLISKRKVANRPGRVEPRAIKKRPRSFPRLHSSRKAAREKIMQNASR
jgi:Transposase DDE domain